MTTTLLHADHVLTLDIDNRVIADGAVVVQDDRIAAVGPAADLRMRYPGVPVRRLSNRLLMPGLVNAHLHSGLLRGTAEGLPVWDWLRMFIDPMHRVLSPEDAEAASFLCYAEAVLSGTTTVVDMWRYMDGSAHAAQQIGNRTVMVPYVGEHPDYDYFDHLDDTERLLENWHGGADGRVEVWVGLEHAFYATEPAHARAIALARKFGTGFHTHSNEAEVELREMHRRYGCRSIPALEKLGLLDAPRTLLAHCVWLDDAEIELMARRGIAVAHNPASNMKLASGAAPVEKLRRAGVAVGIGTDGEKENNNLDMFEEMKFTSLLAKFASLDAAAMPAWDVLRMATIEGARAIGKSHEIGSLEAGKKADLIAVRTNTPRLTPLIGGSNGNLHHNLVHAVRGGDVDLTMIDGRIVVEDGALKTADMAELIQRVNAVVPGLFARRAAWLAGHADGATSPISRT
ncbi:amidohydrolase [Kaistia dalseonensis]|uniref:5-methylthioadenosine/S-adenosylhomocysteine deaminase n=1 Tax=Kaistia dalseonensis TaxID=410840 RepID=A0ABU0H439_9HYPH|nr:amidohydrolase [Kaistia dalseonensis]MCX5494494.1 amidohydrolase [Kaistia dalseonensis]MDQ0437073.1 5-methylthioadenosine/S-adenosylhomocysteine deaminase [Kaistia dalseonensis]